jgi:hypothetical protein
MHFQNFDNVAIFLLVLTLHPIARWGGKKMVPEIGEELR